MLELVVTGELRYGADRNKQTRFNHSRLEMQLSEARTIAFDDAARAFGHVRSRLEDKGAHALSLSVTLVTDTVEDFARVDGLKLENWC